MKRLLTTLVAMVSLIAAPIAANAGSASLVLDARTGSMLSTENADVLNHPASLTKMMTLYMTFEALHAGKLNWSSPVAFSSYASSRPPTKLRVKAGTTITVQEAVLGMIVLSANDAATAMAEKLGGSEERFAQMMTAKARKLGMSRTTFVNASGLPDDRQLTTARDMSTLAVALLRNYPQEYQLFSTPSFNFRGRIIRGHNNLMYRYKGMDGIKTGYTNASGFNLVSAVRQGDRRLIGVVLGGRTARSRDAKMEAMLNRFLAPDAPATQTQIAKVKAPPAPVEVAAAPAPKSRKALEIAPKTPAPRKPVEVASAADNTDAAMPFAIQQRPTVVPGATAYSDENIPFQRPSELNNIAPSASSEKIAGWQVQISAAPSQEAAMALLTMAKSHGGSALKKASPYAEPIGSGSATLYRARFTGFESRKAALSACDALKKQSYDCVLLGG